MKRHSQQRGLSITGFIVMLVSFAVFAFGSGWFFKHYFANRYFLVKSSSSEFPYEINVDAAPAGLTTDGSSLVFSNRVSPWGFVRLTPMENGHYQKESYPVLDNKYQQQVSFNGVTWNGKTFVATADGSWFDSPYPVVFVELGADDFSIRRVIGRAPNHTHCIAWDGITYWAGLRYKDPEEDGPPLLYRFDREMNLLGRYPAPGKGCQGLTWDGNYLWWLDVFDDAVTLFDVSASTPRKVHDYTFTIAAPAGISFDGQSIWIGDHAESQLHRLNQQLYFDWLGKRFDINHHDQLTEAVQSDQHDSRTDNMEKLLQPFSRGEVKTDAIPGFVESLRKRYNDGEILQILEKAREKTHEESIISAINSELNRLAEPGKIDYSDDSVVDDESIKVTRFSAEIVDNDLVASWKLVAGNDVYSGIDAERPAEIPQDYDFETFIRYIVRVIDKRTDEITEFNYDMFYDEEAREGVTLIKRILPGEYRIDIDINAQYFTRTEAKKYNSRFGLEMRY
jgi:hypothetical protein